MEAGMGSRAQHVKGAREVRAVLNAALHKYQIRVSGVRSGARETYR
jgi:hypothetical protein